MGIYKQINKKQFLNYQLMTIIEELIINPTKDVTE